MENLPNTWKLNNTLPNNPWVKEITRQILKYFEVNENENTTCQNFWNAAKAVLTNL